MPLDTTVEPNATRPAPEIIDLRCEGAGAMHAFADEADEPSLDAPPPSALLSGSSSESLSESLSGSALTYERYFGLREKPFSLSTDPRFLYRSDTHTPVLGELAAAIRRREGLIVLTGDIGTGKTTLCRAVLSQLDRKTFATFVPDPFGTREDLLKTMLVEFGATSVEDLVKGRLKGASRPDLSFPLYEFLRSLHPLDAFAVLVVDEVQNLSVPLLEEVRILADLEDQGRKLLQVVLVGQPEFEEQLRLPRLRQLRQRVTVHCRLQPLLADDTAGYVAHRLFAAGMTAAQVRFTDDAARLVHRATRGVPRAINLLCDRAMAVAEAARASRIDGAAVRAAAAQLPWIALEPLDDEPCAEPVVGRAAPQPAPSQRSLLESGGNPPSVAPELAALLDLPPTPLALDDDSTGRATRPHTTRPPAPARAWRWPMALDSLRPVTVSALVALGVLTGVSGVTYWWWLRPLVSGALPPVVRPTMLLSSLGPLNLSQRTSPGGDAARVRAAASATSGDEAALPEAPGPSGPVEASRAGDPVDAGAWVVQTGAFADQARAAALTATLASLGFSAFEDTIAAASGTTLRGVFVGPYADRSTALAALARVREQPGLEQAVVRRSPN